MTRTIWWEDNQVKMIDQRILPLALRVMSYADYRDVAAAITDMVVRGAPAIGAAGGFGMALAAQQSPARDRDSLLGDLAPRKAVLDAARPTAVNLSWATARIMRLAQLVWLTLRRTPADDIRSAVLAEAQRIADEDVEINRRMGAFGAEIVPQTANILTHCNAGSLATVDYGTTLGVVRAAVEPGKQVHVWVDETRPRLQGARLTAWELMRDGIPMTLDRRQRLRHADAAGQGRPGALRCGSRGGERRRGEQDRLLQAGRARAGERHPVLLRRADADHRPEPGARRPDPDRGARRRAR